MAIIFRFRMLTDENDNFVRDYEVQSDMTLTQFHEFIAETLEYEEAMVSFHTADGRWEKIEEFTMMDMGDDGPRLMDSVRLDEIMTHIGDRLVYNFDMMQNRAYYLELMVAERANEEFSYPRELFAHGTAPDQYDPDLSVNDGSIFDEMMDGFNDFEGDESADDEYYY